MAATSLVVRLAVLVTGLVELARTVLDLLLLLEEVMHLIYRLNHQAWQVDWWYGVREGGGLTWLQGGVLRWWEVQERISWVRWEAMTRVGRIIIQEDIIEGTVFERLLGLFFIL